MQRKKKKQQLLVKHTIRLRRHDMFRRKKDPTPRRIREENELRKRSAHRNIHRKTEAHKRKRETKARSLSNTTNILKVKTWMLTRRLGVKSKEKTTKRRMRVGKLLLFLCRVDSVVQ